MITTSRQNSCLGGRSFSSDITARREAPSARGTSRSGEERTSEVPATPDVLSFTRHSPLATSHFLSAFTLLAALFLCASALHAGTVTGTVKNGTNGKPAANIQMIL